MQVRGHRVAGHRAFHLARPTGDLDADFGILPQALHHALRALAGAEDIDPLDQNGQLDQPGKADPPSEQRDRKDDQPDRGRAASPAGNSAAPQATPARMKASTPGTMSKRK